MTDGVEVRSIAFFALYEVLEKKKQSHIVFREALKRKQLLFKEDRAFFTRLCEGVLERLLKLDYILNCFCKTPVEKQKPALRTALRMAVYQMFYMESVPDRAAVSETLKLLDEKGLSGLKGFANGVLRNISRKKETISFPCEKEEPKQWLSLETSSPLWLVEKLCKDYGYETAKRMLFASLEPARVTARVQKASRKEVLSMLSAEGVLAEPVEDFSEAIWLQKFDYLEGVETFQKGYLQIQDLSSMLVCRAASVKPGMTVMDLCAAPGGKTLHIAEALGGSGMVYARDLTEKKAALIEENKKRAGYDNIKVSVWDARRTDPAFLEQVDLLIADLPCSGLGVIGRKKEIKYECSKQQILDLRDLQREILKASFPYLKMGGRLVFSTCTVTKEENVEQFDWLLREFTLEPVDLTTLLPERFRTKTASLGYVQVLQGVMDCDGFFVAAFQRR